MRAGPTVSTSTKAITTSSPHGNAASGSGGAWEAIIDKAITHVTEYLSSTTREFDPDAPLSTHMLHLLDRGTLRDVVAERNYNELCGCFGCGNKPRGLLLGLQEGRAGVPLSFDWPSSSSSAASSSDDNDDGASGDALDGQQGRKREKKSTTTGPAAVPHARLPAEGGTQPDDGEEIVYEDDLYTAESFRLAQRQRALLNHLQKRRLTREQKASTTMSFSAGAASPRVLRGGLLGASFSQRFCSAECEELYAAGIAPRVPAYVVYDYPSVFGAITNLFPNLSVAALQQLAGAEVSAAWLVQPVHERPSPTSVSAGQGDQLKPVQVGTSFESTEHLRRPAATTTASSRINRVRAAKDSTAARAVTAPRKPGAVEEKQQQQPSSPLLLRTVLEQMQVLQGVWNHEVVSRFPDTHLPRAPPAALTARQPATHRTTPPAPPVTPVPMSAGHNRPALRGSLLLFDFIMNCSGARTRRLFRVHYRKHHAALQAGILAQETGDGSHRRMSFFVRVSRSVVAALEKSCTRHDPVIITGADAHSDAHIAVAGACGAAAAEEDGPRIDPVLQQQRRELLASHLFSEEVAAALSRLLMVDYVLLLNDAWAGVWLKELPLLCTKTDISSSSSKTKETCSLLRSLRFPFAIPAGLLHAAGSSPEVVGLALIFLVAAGCCSDVVWRGCNATAAEETEEDASSSAFEEVAEAVGLSEADITAAVRSLMLGDEAE